MSLLNVPIYSGSSSSSIMEPLGNTLFVSDTGSTTQSRADSLGRIDKPLSFAQAASVCQDGDCLFVFSYEDNAVGSFGGKNKITIIFFNNTTNNSITIQNLGDYCSVSSYGVGNGMYPKIEPHVSGYGQRCVFRNVRFEGNPLILETGTLLDSCIISSSAMRLNGIIHINKCKFDTTPLTLFSNSYAPTTFTHCQFPNARDLTFNIGLAVFKDCIFNAQSAPIFTMNSGANISTSMIFDSCYIDNPLGRIFEDSSTSKTPNFQLRNSYIRTSITLGRLPSVSHNTLQINPLFIPRYEF